MKLTDPTKSTRTILFAAAMVVAFIACMTSHAAEVANDQGRETASALGTELALTPPMGWNSWNAFEKDIDEDKIKAIADAMVSSGMRDAGYTYLVLDDAWMASERDQDGRLMADPNKFPSGMKAIGDYIHSKGLKFGIYEDRGHLTCQQLPGSFRHEHIDMETFAQWGVDYIKMDSCFAENNGRMSSEDYALYREGIEATGRPIVLSISDFGNAAWAWGGASMAQLWRTSGDIYPWMDSVYHCANTSAGDQAIHPAFNGLWQFAGPGHWNDPDMLQVGNLKYIDNDQKDTGDRAHFSLWCILAAPLMAGNDLRAMSDGVCKVLTAPELIAVNQDRRGIQGYRIFNEVGCEVYNKPLSDGTTTVLLLNKGEKKADITVHWNQIGLSGNQPVRDLWACEDLGEFEDGFTARNLGQHEHTMIKVGRPGPPLPAPATMPLEKYTVTHDGETYLSDLYYIWKADHAPVYNATYTGDPIRIAGQTFKKGLGCKSKSAVMFRVDGRADRFRATVALDPSSKADAKGRFRVYDEDFFANRVLWDSGEMTTDSPAKEINIELNNVQCLMLVLDGKEVLGNWADARVISEDTTTRTEDTQASVVTAHSQGLHGYIGFSASRPPDRTIYSVGMGFYSAVWPLIDKPIADFQIGLPSAWITPDNSDNKDTPLAPIGTLARDNWPERGPTWAAHGRECFSRGPKTDRLPARSITQSITVFLNHSF